MEPDFSGWATKANLRCSDGRTIMEGAFSEMDGARVPLVWAHRHNEPTNVLGHAILTAKPEGIWADGFFNDSEQAKHSKTLVQHQDVDTMSIFANELVEKSKQVFHGVIREVSLVLAGANPGAKIQNIRLQHSMDPDDFDDLDDQAVIYHGLGREETFEKPPVVDEKAKENADATPIEDAADEEPTAQEVYDSLNDEQRDVVHSMIGAALKGTGVDELAHADLTVKDVYDSFTEDQKNVVHYMIGAALEASDSAAHSGIDTTEGDLAHQEGTTMPRNAFDDADSAAGGSASSHVLSHDALGQILTEAKRPGGSTFKELVLAHAAEYGIEDIDLLFPDARALDNVPQMKMRRNEWVSKVLDGTKQTPFAKVKSIVADVTAEEARARGYVKGKKKVDEVIKLLRRTTGPATIYKKQRLDRDDILDITDMNVVAFLKAEMRMMLEEEIARAILVGDGRSSLSDDKVKDPEGAVSGDGIRSIYHDDDLYAITHQLGANVAVKDSVKGMVRARAKYRGTGKPTLFCSDNWLTDVMLEEDKFGRSLYETEQSLADKLRVKEIVTVDLFDEYPSLMAIMVNLQDYSIGTNRGGELTSFEDFDIDFNQHKYLQETRLSGGLTKPFSAVIVTREEGTSATPAAPSFDAADNEITIPTTTGVVYTIDDEPVTGVVTITHTTEVEATADEGYYIPSNSTKSWTYTYTP